MNSKNISRTPFNKEQLEIINLTHSLTKKLVKLKSGNKILNEMTKIEKNILKHIAYSEKNLDTITNKLSNLDVKVDDEIVNILESGFSIKKKLLKLC